MSGDWEVEPRAALKALRHLNVRKLANVTYETKTRVIVARGGEGGMSIDFFVRNRRRHVQVELSTGSAEHGVRRF